MGSASPRPRATSGPPRARCSVASSAHHRPRTLPRPDVGAYYPPAGLEAAPYRYTPPTGVFSEYSGRYEDPSIFRPVAYTPDGTPSDAGAADANQAADAAGPEITGRGTPDLASKLGTAFHALGDLISGKVQD